MRSIVPIAVVAFVVGACGLSAQSSPKQAAVQKELLQLEKDYNGAYARNDLPAYFSYLADDFNQWLPEGRTNKAEYVSSWTKFVKDGGKILKADMSDIIIQVAPSADSAVVSYILHVITRSPKETADENYQESDVLFKRGGQWKVVHLNYARAAKQPSKQP
jgi:ketosteroid isomerase-like protein